MYDLQIVSTHMDFPINRFSILPSEILMLLIWTVVKYGGNIRTLMDVSKAWRSILTNPKTLLVMDNLKWMAPEHILNLLHFKAVPLGEGVITTVFPVYYAPNSVKILSGSDINFYINSFLNHCVGKSWESLRLPTFRDFVFYITNCTWTDSKVKTWENIIASCKSIATFHHIFKLMITVNEYGSDIDIIRAQFDIDQFITDEEIKKCIISSDDIDYALKHIFFSMEAKCTFLDGSFTVEHIDKIIEIYQGLFGKKWPQKIVSCFFLTRLINVGYDFKKIRKIIFAFHDTTENSQSIWHQIQRIVGFDCIGDIMKTFHSMMSECLEQSKGKNIDIRFPEYKHLTRQEFALVLFRELEIYHKWWYEFVIKMSPECIPHEKPPRLFCTCTRCWLIEFHKLFEIVLDNVRCNHSEIFELNDNI